MSAPSGQKFDYRNIVLLVGVVAVCFGLGEWLFRSLSLTDRLGFQQVPSVAERVASVTAKRPGTIRIVGLGDSFTIFREAQGRNFLRYAEQLAGTGSPRLDMVNLAEAGAGFQDYARNLVRYGDQLDPDVIVLGLYLGNDVAPFGGPTVRDLHANGRLLTTPESTREPSAIAGIAALAKKSVLLNFLYRKAKIYVPALRSGFFENIAADLQKRDGLSDAEVEARLQKIDPQLIDLARADAINGWDLAGAMFSPEYYVHMYTLPPGSPYANELDKRLDDMNFIIDWARRRNVEPVVVLLHPSIIINARYQDYFRRLGYDLPALDAAPLALVDRLTRHLDDRGVAYVDTLAPLRSSAGNDFIANDVHLNSAGQAVVGKALYDLLKNRGILRTP